MCHCQYTCWHIQYIPQLHPLPEFIIRNSTIPEGMGTVAVIWSRETCIYLFTSPSSQRLHPFRSAPPGNSLERVILKLCLLCLGVYVRCRSCYKGSKVPVVDWKVANSSTLCHGVLSTRMWHNSNNVLKSIAQKWSWYYYFEVGIVVIL